MPQLHFFTTTWSTPGQLMEPMVRKAAADYGLDFYLHDTDDDPGLVRRHGLRTLPTVILMEEDRIIRRWVGFYAEHELRRHLDGGS